MNLDGAIQTFLAEATDLLEAMEQALLRLEGSGLDSETLNEIFRAAHTIKGSAGLFGMDNIVSFTHVVENVLDRARANKIELDQELQGILLKCRDHIGVLLADIANDRETSELTLADGEQLQVQLTPWLSEELRHQTDTEAAPSKDTHTEGAWHISLRLNPEVLSDGMDPLSFFRFLAGLGEITQFVTIDEHLPDNISEFNPERLYLGFEIDFVGNVDRAEIEEVFDFIKTGSDIRIIPPSSKLSEYINLIRALPESNYRLGEILIKSGAITQKELDHALDTQTIQSMEKQDVEMLGEILATQHSVAAELVNVALDKQKKLSEKRLSAETHYIRVDAEKLDRLINSIGELVISRQRVDLIAGRIGEGSLLDAVNDLGGFTEQIRDAALTLRMVPIGDTFQRFRRVVRDTAEELGKNIELKIRGAETELDRSMVEKLTDPLTHIVRNAMDHGIEEAAVRLTQGKSETGTLLLSACHDSGNIVIEVSDDGKGLDLERIRAKAIGNGIIEPNANLTDNEIKQLIFHPGLSTAETVTNLSGRGVGMDVVKKNIDALQGSVDVESKKGAGTRIRIRLPLTLAIIDGFHVICRNSHFIIPQNTVLECIDLTTLKKDEGRSCVNLRGEQIPTIKLSQIYALPSHPHLQEEHKEELVIVQFGENRAGIVVEGLYGEVQTVVKPLSPLFQSLQGIGGSSLLGSGDIAFILDIPQLIQLATNRENTANRKFQSTVIQER